MLIIIVSILSLLASIVIIAVIIIKKFPVLSAIDVATLPQEKEAQTKNKIIKERISRKMSTAVKVSLWVATPLKTVWEFIVQQLQNIYGWLLELREKHKTIDVIKGASVASEEEASKNIEKVLGEADKLINKEKFSEAEKKLIAVISHDPKNSEAYAGLSDLYRAQREWQQASEVLTYLCRILAEELEQEPTGERKQYLALSLCELSECYQEMGDGERALDVIKQAVMLDPNNPKFLNQQVLVYIMLGQRLRAERAVEQLRQANPENQKLQELENKVATLSY